MKTLILKEDLKFSKKATAIIVGVCVLASIFVLFNTAQAEGVPCMSIWKHTSKDHFVPGERFDYIIGLSNEGTGTAHGISMGDSFEYQQYLEVISAVPSPTNVRGDTWFVGDLMPGERREIYINVRVKTNVPAGTTKVDNMACLSCTTDPCQQICSVATIFIDNGNPNLTITKLVDKTIANPADEIIYTLNYSNTGSAPATNVVVKDPFSNQNQSYLSFISSSPSPSSGTDTWNIGTLSAGQSGTITIRARISNSAFLPIGTTEIKNRGSILSSGIAEIYSNYVSTSVTVNSLAPTCSISASPSNISIGQYSTLNWTSQNATSCYASNAWSGAKSLSGNQSVSPSSYSTYTLTCNGSGGTTTCSTWVSVNDNNPVPSCSIYANPSTIVNGQYSTLNWTSQNATSCYASNAWSGTKSLSGNQSVSPSSYSTYTLTCNGSGGTTTCSTWVSVNAENQTHTLSINKLGRNISRGQNTWYDSFIAGLGEEVEFSIQVTNIGSAETTNVKVWDVLPSGMDYISGSTTVNGSYRGDGITTGGIYLGTISINQSVEIRFRAKVLTYVSSGSYSSFGTINIGNQNVQSSSGASMIELGRNLTQNQTNWTNSISANYNDEIEFSIQISNNTGSNLNNVFIKEILPSTLSLIGDTTTINGTYWNGDIVSSGINLGNLDTNQTAIIKFKAKFIGTSYNNSISNTLTNTAYANGNDISQISDQASVVIVSSGSGQVLGASVVTGVGFTPFSFVLMGVSLIIAFFVYCSARENQILDYLGAKKGNIILKGLIKFYFKTKLTLKLATLRFKQTYF